MVHRPTDSRLLTNLLQQEKEYSKQLNSLLVTSNASLASVAAYAAASSQPASNVVMAVVGSLAGADDALRRYAQGVEQWRDTMRLLKESEEEVGNIMRDREILVTRVIKASKSKSSSPNVRESLLLSGANIFSSSPSHSNSASSANLNDSPSHSPSPLGSSRPLSGSFLNFNPNSKLAAAQAELQACEAHLAAKERELSISRYAAIRDGLGERVRAMINCGWAWGELGREALHSLEELNVAASTSGGIEVLEHRPPLVHEPHLGSLPDTMGHSSYLRHSIGSHDPNLNSERPSSDLSSVGLPPPGHEIKTEDEQNVGYELREEREVNSPAKSQKVDTVKTGILGEVVPKPSSNNSKIASSEPLTQMVHQPNPASTPPRSPSSHPYVPSRPLSGMSTITGGSSQYYATVTPTTYKVENVMYAPAVAIHVPSRPLNPTTPSDANNVTNNNSNQRQSISMNIPAPHALEGYAYDIPTATSVASPPPPNFPSYLGPTTTPTASQLQRQLSVASGSGSGVLNGSRVSLHQPQPVAILHTPHVLERRITEEAIKVVAGPSGRQDMYTEEEDDLADDEKAFQEGKLAVVENPRFMTETRKKELERERRRAEKEKATPQAVPATQNDPFSTPTLTGPLPSSSSPSKVYTRQTSPSKGFLSGLRGLFGASGSKSPPPPPPPAAAFPQPNFSGIPPTPPSATGQSNFAENLDNEQDLERFPSDSDGEGERGKSKRSTSNVFQRFFLGSSPGSPKKKDGTPKGHWETRTDKNLRDISGGYGLKSGNLDYDAGHYPLPARPSVVQSGVVEAQNWQGRGRGEASLRGRAASYAGPPPSSDLGDARRAERRAEGSPSSPTNKLQKSSNAKNKMKTTRLGPAILPSTYIATAPPPVGIYGGAVGPLVTMGTQPGGGGGIVPGAVEDKKKKLKSRRSASMDVNLENRRSWVPGSDEDTEKEDKHNLAGGQGRIVDLGKRRRTASETVVPPAVPQPVVVVSALGIGTTLAAEATPVKKKKSTKKKTQKSGPPPPSQQQEEKQLQQQQQQQQQQQDLTSAPPPPTQIITTPTRKASTKSAKPPSRPHHHHHSATSLILPANSDMPSGTLVSQPGWDTQAQAPGGGLQLSRHNSGMSTGGGGVSADVVADPGASGGASKSKKPTVLGHGVGGSGGLARRSSLGSSSGPASSAITLTKAVEANSPAPVNVGPPPQPTGVSVPAFVQPTAPVSSLMSIVEGAARADREGWKRTAPTGSGGIGMVKAPPPMKRDALEKLDAEQFRSLANAVSGSAATGMAMPSLRMFEVKAPDLSAITYQVDQKLSAKPFHDAPSTSAPQPSSSIVQPVTQRLTPHGQSPRSAKLPLRSALRNPSRTPSPMPSTVLAPDNVHPSGLSSTSLPPPADGMLPWGEDGTLHTPRKSYPQKERKEKQPSKKYKGKGKARDVKPTDSDSGESSYATGNEFQTDVEEIEKATKDINAPSTSQVMGNGHAVGYVDRRAPVQESKILDSTGSTNIPGLPFPAPAQGHQEVVTQTSQTTSHIEPVPDIPHTPRRRKSVRVSLQPTFSPPPPAMEYDYEDEQRQYPLPRPSSSIPEHGGHKQPSGGGYDLARTVSPAAPLPAPIPVHGTSVRRNAAQKVEEDMWADSDEDVDEEYTKAKKMLRRAKQKEKDVNLLVANFESSVRPSY